MDKSGPPPPYAQGTAPPQMGFNPPPTQQQPQVVVHQVASVGPTPQAMICPSCHAHIQTRMQYESSTRTHLFAFLLCIFGCWLCCCIPYCMDSCQNGNHYCPSCGTYLGTYHA